MLGHPRRRTALFNSSQRVGDLNAPRVVRALVCRGEVPIEVLKCASEDGLVCRGRFGVRRHEASNVGCKNRAHAAKRESGKWRG